MKNGCCCRQNSDVSNASRTWTQVARQTLSWIVPSVMLAAMPKCPLCLAAYVALFTGLGISLATAKFAWWFVEIGCVAVLVYLMAARVSSFFRSQ